MMDKTASEAYFQGAHEALQSMNIPHHIKVAAAEYLTKTASEADFAAAIGNTLGEKALANRPSLGAKLKGLAAKHPKSARGLLAAGGLTAAGLGLNSLLGQEEEEAGFSDRLMSGDLSPAELAALGIGGAGLVGGAAYGANKLL